MVARTAFLISTIFFATACDIPAGEKLPRLLLPPVGTVSAHEFVSLFSQTCVAHFSDFKKIVAKSKNLGLELDKDQSKGDIQRLRHKNKDLFAASGLASDHTRIYQFCNVQALLSNPTELERALMEMKTPDGVRIELGDDKNFPDPAFRSGTFRNSNGFVRVSFNQRIVNFKPQRDTEWPEECNLEKRCENWGFANLAIEWTSQP